MDEGLLDGGARTMAAGGFDTWLCAAGNRPWNRHAMTPEFGAAADGAAAPLAADFGALELGGGGGAAGAAVKREVSDLAHPDETRKRAKKRATPAYRQTTQWRAQR